MKSGFPLEDSHEKSSVDTHFSGGRGHWWSLDSAGWWRCPTERWSWCMTCPGCSAQSGVRCTRLKLSGGSAETRLENHCHSAESLERMLVAVKYQLMLRTPSGRSRSGKFITLPPPCGRPLFLGAGCRTAGRFQAEYSSLEVALWLAAAPELLIGRTGCDGREQLQAPGCIGLVEFPPCSGGG